MTEPVPPRRPRKGGKRGGDRTTDGARVEAANRRRQVVQLRMAGADFATIAAQVGYADHTGALKAWRESLAEVVREPAREAVELELQRYDVMIRALWPKVLAGNVLAIRASLEVGRDRQKLMGIAGAVKLDVSTDDARAEVSAAAQELFELLGVDGPEA